MKDSEVIKTLQEWWKEDTASLKTKTIEKLGLDTTKDKIEIGNFLLLKDNFFGGYGLKIKDKEKDLDNLLYSKDSKSFEHLEALYRQKISDISSAEIKNLNINTRINPIIIRNIKITQGGLFHRYRIELNDSNKTPDGKWLDNSIDFKKIISCIEQYRYTSQKCRDFSEVQLNKDLESHFKIFFEKVARSGGKQKSLFDLVLGDMTFVIEIKLASSLKSMGKSYSASGQIKAYLNEFKKKNFLLLVAGNRTDKQDKNVESLKAEVLNDFKCYFYYLESK
jgi:hypothetical protein